MKSRSLYRILFAASVLLVLVPVPSLVRPIEPVHRTIRIEASSFAFDPGVVVVNPGDQVTIELVSTDVVHGLYLDGYDLQMSADPGQSSQLTFTADKSGTFRFRCSVTCGDLHPFMIGKFRVGLNTLLWRGAGLMIFAAFALIGVLRYETT